MAKLVRYLIIANYIILHSFYVYAQTSISDNLLISVIDEPPYYIGGLDSMKIFVAKNLKYPQSAIQDKIEGTVWVNFWIDTAGMTVNHEVIRSVRRDLDEEAIRVSKLIFFSQPAKQKNKPIKMLYIMPFKFELPETKALKEKEDLSKKKKKTK